MSDLADLAADREALDRRCALEAQARRAGLTGKTVADSAFVCVECSEAILEPRRHALLGVQTCFECQSVIEKKEKQWIQNF